PRAYLAALNIESKRRHDAVMNPNKIEHPYRRTRCLLWRKKALLLSVMCATWRCVAVEYLTNDWSAATHSYSDTCPALAPDGTIYLGTFTGRLSAVRPDGSQKWVFRAGLEIK